MKNLNDTAAQLPIEDFFPCNHAVQKNRDPKFCPHHLGHSRRCAREGAGAGAGACMGAGDGAAPEKWSFFELWKTSECFVVGLRGGNTSGHSRSASMKALLECLGGL